MTVTIHFHGASGTVTGSCYRVVHPAGQFLVDCGMFQGNKSVRDLNYKPFPFDPRGIDFLLLTHAHIDHCGLLPKLTANGYRKPIWCTPPTAGLLEYLLIGRGTYHQHGYGTQTRVAAHGVEHLHAVAIRQIQIQQQ